MNFFFFQKKFHCLNIVMISTIFFIVVIVATFIFGLLKNPFCRLLNVGVFFFSFFFEDVVDTSLHCSTSVLVKKSEISFNPCSLLSDLVLVPHYPKDSLS